MTTFRIPCASACALIPSIINSDRRFPHNVFKGEWDAFLFFDSDWMFDSGFEVHIKALLSAEGAHCACITSIDSQIADPSLRCFCISGDTSADEYKARLSGEGETVGWIYDFGRFACAPDSGSWCIYSERSAEIAVMAFRGLALVRYQTIVDRFHAVPFQRAVDEAISHAFSPAGLPGSWRDTFLREYGPR